MMICQAILHKQVLAYAWGDQAQALPHSHVEKYIQQMKWHQEHLLTIHRPQKNTKLAYPNGRVVLEAKLMCQKEMRYGWSAS